MADLLQLWLPILLTAVFVFIASSLIHMVFKWHAAEYRALRNEDEVRAALQAGISGPGKYVLPHCEEMKDMQSETMQQKYREGPLGILLIGPNGLPNMAKLLSQWFVLSLVVAAIAGLMAVQTVGLQGDGHDAGHLVGLASLLAYSAGSVIDGIWMYKPWRSVAKDLLDAVIYAIISALTFMWLWP